MFCCGFIAGVPAIILGNMAKKEIAETGQPGRGMAQAGFILGIIAVVFGILWLIVFASGGIEFNASTS